MRVQRLTHVEHPTSRSLGSHDSGGVIGVVELQAVLPPMVAPAPAHNVLPKCRLRRNVVLQVTKPCKGISEPGVERVCEYEGVERAHLQAWFNADFRL